jgi:hypothetical protein
LVGNQKLPIELVDSEETSGANKFPQHFFSEGKLFFINSATRIKELKRIIVKRGIDLFFYGVHDSPPSLKQII